MRYMTCEELRCLFEHPLGRDFFPQTDSAGVAEHLASCADCAGIVEGRRDLETGLRLTRECVPPLPGSLDDAIVASYRRHMAQRQGLASAKTKRGRRSVAALRWCAAVAAVMLVATALFLARRKTIATVVTPSPKRPIPASQQAITGNTSARVSLPMKPKPPHASSYPAQRKRPAADSADLDNPLPADFRGLMYCDPLSCSGAMEMIRVRLPFSPGDSAIYADVLVGPDGVARGIRIVE
jgi:hypothetical protein